MKFNELQRAPTYIGRFDTLINMKSGRVMALDKRRLDETPFFLLTNPPNNQITVPAGASSKEVAMRVSGEGPMQLIMIGGNTAVSALVRLYTRDGNQMALLMNNPIHSGTMMGSGGNMYPLVEALYVDEDRALSAVFSSLDPDNDVTFSFCAVGAKYTKLQDDPSLARVKKRLKDSQFESIPYWYTLDKNKATLTPYQSASYQITIDPGHNFEIHQIGCFSNSGNQFSIDIIDMTKGESIIQAPRGTHYEVNNLLLCGTNGGYPYKLNEPIIVFGGQRLLVNLTELGGEDNEIYVTLGGRALKVRQWA